MKKSLLTAALTTISLTALAQLNAPDYAWFIDGGLCYRVISEEDATAGLAMPYSTAEVPNAYNDMATYLNGLSELKVPSKAVDDATGKEYNIISIFDGPTNNRPNLKKITIENGVKSISGITGCSSLTEVNLPQSLETLTGMNSLPSLESLELPDGLTAIGDQSLTETGLKSLKIPAGVATIPLLSIRDNNDLENLDLSNVKEFLQGSVCNSNNLKRLVLPNSAFYTDYYTFSLQGLEELWIGDKLTSNDAAICSQAFSGLLSLNKIYSARTIPPVITEQNPMYHPLCFDGTSNWQNITLYVPVGYKEAYSSAYCWKDMNIVEYNFESGISETDSDPAIIEIVTGGIRVNAEGNHTVTVYNPTGAQTFSATVSQGETIPLANGIHIVTCDGKATKVVVK